MTNGDVRVTISLGVHILGTQYTLGRPSRFAFFGAAIRLAQFLETDRGIACHNRTCLPFKISGFKFEKTRTIYITYN